MINFSQSCYLISAIFASLSMGVQLVVLPWLGVSKLELSAIELGALQGAMLLPSLLLLLVGGVLSDQRDSRTLLSLLYGLLAIPHFFLAAILFKGTLSYGLLLIYAFSLGSILSLIQPCRDKLLHAIAEQPIQRWIAALLSVQLLAQIFGFYLAGKIDWNNLSWLLLFQVAVLLSAALLIRGVPRQAESPLKENLLTSVRSALSTLSLQPVLRQLMPFVAFNGFVTMGVYVVAMPILVHRILQQDASFYATLQMYFVLGSVVVTVFLLLKKRVRFPGKWMMMSLFFTGLLMISIATQLSESRLLVQVILWGLCAGVSMAMGRTLVQEIAQNQERARMLSFYQVALFGSAPVGALVGGVLVETFGVLAVLRGAGWVAVMVFALSMLATSLWQFESKDES